MVHHHRPDGQENQLPTDANFFPKLTADGSDEDVACGSAVVPGLAAGDSGAFRLALSGWASPFFASMSRSAWTGRPRSCSGRPARGQPDVVRARQRLARPRVGPGPHLPQQAVQRDLLVAGDARWRSASPPCRPAGADSVEHVRRVQVAAPCRLVPGAAS